MSIYWRNSRPFACGSVYLSVCPNARVSVSLSLWLSFCQSACLSVCLPISLSLSVFGYLRLSLCLNYLFIYQSAVSLPYFLPFFPITLFLFHPLLSLPFSLPGSFLFFLNIFLSPYPLHSLSLFLPSFSPFLSSIPSLPLFILIPPLSSLSPLFPLSHPLFPLSLPFFSSYLSFTPHIPQSLSSLLPHSLSTSLSLHVSLYPLPLSP